MPTLPSLKRVTFVVYEPPLKSAICSKPAEPLSETNMRHCALSSLPPLSFTETPKKSTRSNLSVGLLVPIPTLPMESTNNLPVPFVVIAISFASGE